MAGQLSIAPVMTTGRRAPSKSRRNVARSGRRTRGTLSWSGKTLDMAFSFRLQRLRERGAQQLREPLRMRRIEHGDVIAGRAHDAHGCAGEPGPAEGVIAQHRFVARRI